MVREARLVVSCGEVPPKVLVELWSLERPAKAGDVSLKVLVELSVVSGGLPKLVLVELSGPNCRI